ncbi:MAG: hypothetical protein ACYTFT_00515 [Planctomycetota bacterium]
MDCTPIKGGLRVEGRFIMGSSVFTLRGLGTVLSLLALGFAPSCGGGGGSSAARVTGAPSAQELTLQPTALGAATLSARGGDGGEGVAGARGGAISVTSAEVALVASGAGQVAGETDANADTPDDPERLFVASGSTVTMTTAELEAKRFKSILIEGTLTIDVAAKSNVNVLVLGDVRISGTIDYTLRTHIPALTFFRTTGGGVFRLEGLVDFAEGALGVTIQNFAEVVLASGSAIDLRGRSGLVTSDGGSLAVGSADRIAIRGQVFTDGGSGGDGATSFPGVGGGITLGATSQIVLAGDGLQTFGGEGGAFVAAGQAGSPGAGGAGGDVTLSGQSTTIGGGNVVRVSGGRANGNPHAGGDAGSIKITGVAALSARLEAIGGFSPTDAGGAGGQIEVEFAANVASVTASGTFLTIGGATDTGQGGAAGELVLFTRRLSTSIELLAGVFVNGGPAVGNGDGGAGGYCYVGGSLAPKSGQAYLDAIGVSLRLAGDCESRGGESQGGQGTGAPGAGGIVHMNVASVEVLGAVRALDGLAQTLGSLLGRATVRLGAIVSILGVVDDNDDDADPAVVGDLDAATARP